MADTSHDISTLNSLLSTTIDSVNGYRAAAEDSESGRFGSFFTTQSAERQRVATSLASEVSRLGGTPEESGTALGGAHRAFLSIKDAITGKDEQSIINEVERGEDHIKAKFENALKDTSLSPSVMAVVSELYTSVKSGHDQARDLKHGLQAAHGN